jgi:hypothetical protein
MLPSCSSSSYRSPGSLRSRKWPAALRTSSINPSVRLPPSHRPADRQLDSCTHDSIPQVACGNSKNSHAPDLLTSLNLQARRSALRHGDALRRLQRIATSARARLCVRRHRLHQRAQTIHAFAHISHTSHQPDTYARRPADHDRDSSRITALNVFGGTSPRTLRRCPWENSI